MYSESELVFISALQHYSYCPRQCALIHVEEVFDQNHLTMRGNAVHRRVDKPGRMLAGRGRTEYALPLFSESLGLIGKADAVEFDSAGNPFPVEYKHGKRRMSRHDDLQLAAQAMCLEEMTGKAVSAGAIYHHTSRRRRDVNIGEELRQNVRVATAAIREMMKTGDMPAPVNDKRCFNCSLNKTCQPEIIGNAGDIGDDMLRAIVEEGE